MTHPANHQQDSPTTAPGLFISQGHSAARRSSKTWRKIPIGSMGQTVYLATWMVDLYGKLVG